MPIARFRNYPKAISKKFSFIISIIHKPDLVILDEPFSGLDPVNQLLLKEIIGELQKTGRLSFFDSSDGTSRETLRPDLPD
jgi:ABC-2 type transport system ATP-binding protein